MSPPSSQALQELDRLDKSSSDFDDKLHDVLYGQEYALHEKNFEDGDLVWLIDYLDETLRVHCPDLSPRTSRKCRRELRSICSARAILPTSYVLSSQLLETGPLPFATGGFGDVYKGIFDRSTVCVKRVRLSLRDFQEKKKEFCKEAVVWKNLNHPNVLPLLGITVDPSQLQLVSKWVSGGNMREYIKKHPDADRRRLLSGVAEGIRYLHSCDVIHGDLKGANILVEDIGHILIADFGLTKITENPNSIRAPSLQNGLSNQWAAPEVWEKREYSKEADIFSFAMVMIEIFTGATPFDNYHPLMAMLNVTQGRRPPRPAHPTFTEKLWELTQRCWDQNPELRPGASEVLRLLLATDPPAWEWLTSSSLSPDKPDWWMYKRQMDFLCFGDALWEPAPTNKYDRVSVGDVGFIHRDVPATFEPLTIGEVACHQPRPPCCLGTSTVRRVGASVGATPSPNLPPEYDTSFSFELTGNRGAALVTKYRTYREDTPSESKFEVYIKRHYNSWVAFARHKRYGDDVQPVLVSGFDMTRDFAMVAYSNESASGELNSTIAVPMVASASASLWGTWHGRCTPHTNYGPQECNPPPPERVIDPRYESSQSTEASRIPSDFNQCVFIRYYTIRKLLRLFPMVIRAAAGPHDLGPGDNKGNTFSELMAQPNIKDEDDTDLEPDIVIHNTPSERDYDSWRAVADYVFENDSNATAVLMHHRDLEGIHLDGVHDISTLLAMNRPHIVVDESGVGRIIRRQDPSLPEGSTIITTTPPAPPVTSDIPASISGVQRRLVLDPADANYQGTPGTTEQMIARIIQGGLDPQLLDELFDAEDYLAVLRVCPEPQRYIDGLYQIFCDLSLDSPVRPRCFRALRRGGGDLGVLPTSYHIQDQFELQDELPIANGGFADVWKANGPAGATALKVIRLTKEDDFQQVKKQFCKEVLVSKLVNHGNVLAIDGVQMVDGVKLHIISKWMEHEDMETYIGNNPDADRIELLLGVTRGLGYLHTIGVVHGDLKSTSVLIDSNHKPRLTGFGLSSVTKNISFNASTERRGGTTRWKAPELLPLSLDVTEWDKAKSARSTEKSDTYSLAMVVIEIFTGRHPWPLHSDERVILLLAQDRRPEKPTHEQFTSKLWSLTKECWNKDPRRRPNISEVLNKLEPGKGNNRLRILSASLSALFGGRSDTNRLI